MTKKEKKSLEFIKNCLIKSTTPVVLCSFGKDSMVLLHLVLRCTKVPVIFWREPFFQEKFIFPQTIAAKWDLSLYDFPPFSMNYLQVDDYFEVFNTYLLGNGVRIIMSTGIQNRKKKDKKYLCVQHDLLERPTGMVLKTKWDCIFHGHKRMDPMGFCDKVEVPWENGMLKMAIAEWTDKDIWDYIYKYNLPYNKKRYDDHKDSENCDVFSACYECLDYRNIGIKVICPKTHKEIKCIAKTKEASDLLKEKYLSIFNGR